MKLIKNRSGFFRQAALLWLAGVISYLAAIPYFVALLGDKLQEQASLAGMTPSKFLLLSGVNTSIVLGICVFIGLLCASRIGLKAPLSAHFLGIEKLEVKTWIKTSLKPAAIWALALGLIVIALNLAMSPWLPEVLKAGTIDHTWWQALLASFYGGIAEELQLRLGVLTFVAWGLHKLFKKSDTVLSNRIFWTANIFAALLFGIAHLPATAALTPLTAIVVFRALILNGLPGLGFGVLYRRHGLEAAMVSHFITDLVIHLLPALFA